MGGGLQPAGFPLYSRHSMDAAAQEAAVNGSLRVGAAPGEPPFFHSLPDKVQFGPARLYWKLTNEDWFGSERAAIVMFSAFPSPLS